MASPLSSPLSPLSPTVQGGLQSPPSSRLGDWVLTAALLLPVFFVLFPASFALPDFLRSLDGLWRQLGFLRRAELENLLILLILLGIFSFLYVRQVRFLISDYHSWYPSPLHHHASTESLLKSKPGDRRLLNAADAMQFTPVTTSGSLKDTRSPMVSGRED